MNQSAKLPNKIRKVLRNESQELSLSFYDGSEIEPFAELTRCVDEEIRKGEFLLQHSMEQENSDTNGHGSDRIRIVGAGWGDPAGFTISIDHDCDGWVILVEYRSPTRVFVTSGSSSRN
jgi:hypothetical protein